MHLEKSLLPVDVELEVSSHVSAKAGCERRSWGFVGCRHSTRQGVDTPVRRGVAIGAGVAGSGTSVRHGCAFSTDSFVGGKRNIEADVSMSF